MALLCFGVGVPTRDDATPEARRQAISTVRTKMANILLRTASVVCAVRHTAVLILSGTAQPTSYHNPAAVRA